MKKKLNDYFNRSIRKIKHRKGFGVHSPFAFSIITEVIEEKLPYYAYRPMQGSYPKSSIVPFKVVTLLFRLANRFGSRNIAVIGDEQYASMPLQIVDSRNHLIRISDAQDMDAVVEEKFDMIVVNLNPLSDQSALTEWLLTHMTETAIIFVKGILPHHSLETFWDDFCDRDEVPITMDLYDYGLAIIKPNFFKQHYIVSF